ncbi:D-2-hydroxyacid dehydrogenase [Pseudomaricurvus alkylphenolicus]|uniref:D-2-hydroxyacid dehydrogenase n=1 Tax=Pseudomaricurvus alkylphenolicus TaxID=1306991 RepID=UPI001423EA30|nr:D-2-hydroxyacid dehydrogenase [Pseudomaricurvus alkylphenolicus]NIB39065.1 D-2-hydroxyacid dehydrogenase [Pseudomaricurvus alkylphenolicus]
MSDAKSPAMVVLDGYTLNPGDLSWESLSQLGELAHYDHTLPAEVVERCADAEVVFTNKTPIDDAAMERLPKLRYIGVLATGYNIVDVEAARRRGIVVTNTPAYGSDSVAQFVFAQLLNWAQPIAYYGDTVKQGRWAASRDFCYYDHSMLQLAGATLGVVGYGAIGRQVATIARAFGMKVLVNTRTRPQSLPEGVEFADLETLASNSDVISLHCPLTDANKAFVNEAFLNRMKSSAYLINTGRGPLIDEAALEKALNERRIAGAALDVLAVEPPSADHPLVALENCTVTPHIAWATLAARQRLMDIAVANLQAFLAGEAQNQV